MGSSQAAVMVSRVRVWMANMVMGKPMTTRRERATSIQKSAHARSRAQVPYCGSSSK